MTDHARKSDLYDITVVVHHQTDDAVLVSDDGDRRNAVWLPLSAIEIEPRDRGMAEITAPERLLQDKGLI